VGRLEYHAYGLVFLTNDGDLANSILQSHHLPQTYQIKLKSLLTFAEIDEFSRATGARISRRGGQSAPWYEVTLAEARRDALRDRLFRSGHPVEKMKRIALANLELGSLPPGQHRELSGGDLSGLRLAIKRQGSAPGKSPLPKHRPAPQYQPAARQRPALKQQRPGHSRPERKGAVSSNAGKRGKNSHGSHSSKSRDRSRSKGPRR
jgi:pseudouridine synthase